MFGIFRTSLALLVVIGHLLGPFQLGTFAVFGFYILSGYLMTYVMQNTYSYNMHGQLKFLMNRILRIYPSYWFAALFSLILLLLCGTKITEFKPIIFFPENSIEILQNIFLVFTSTSSPRLSPATWALTVELFFYICICFGASKSPARTIVWFFLSLLYTIYLLASDPMNWQIRYFPIFAASLPFSFGACIFYFKDNFKKHLNVKCLSSPVFLFILVIINFSTSYLISKLVFSWWLFSIGFYINFILMALCIISLLSMSSDIKMKKLDNIIGQYSYPLYLVHWQVGGLLYWLTSGLLNKEMSINRLLFLVVGILLALAVSHMMIIFIDRPIENIRKRIKSNKSRHAVRKNTSGV